jgi:UDP:flavonoid glycosyltransferase YjiC (YdhE family)
MLPVIRHLRECGVEPVYAVPDPEIARKYLGAEAPRLIRAVPRPRPEPSRRAPASFADILLDGGFRDREALATTVDAWKAIYREERVEAVLLDYAPMAQLAAWLLGLRMVSSAVSFALPPVPIPPFRRGAADKEAAESSERELLASVNFVCALAGRASINSLAPWLHAPTRFITGIPQVNVYDFEPDGGYLGPIGELAGAQTADWPEKGRRRVLCYLKWSRELPAFIKSIDDAERAMVCVVPNAPEDWLRSVPASRIRIFNKPVAMQPLIQEAEVVVSNASNGIACEALIAGKPQLLMPIDQEKALIAARLVGLKAALSLAEKRPAAQSSSYLERLLDDSTFEANAKKISTEQRPKDWKGSLARLGAALAK